MDEPGWLTPKNVLVKLPADPGGGTAPGLTERMPEDDGREVGFRDSTFCGLGVVGFQNPRSLKVNS